MKPSLATEAVKLNKHLCKCMGYTALNVKQQGVCTDCVLDCVKPLSNTGLGTLTKTLQSFKSVARLCGQITDMKLYLWQMLMC